MNKRERRKVCFGPSSGAPRRKNRSPTCHKVEGGGPFRSCLGPVLPLFPPGPSPTAVEGPSAPLTAPPSDRWRKRRSKRRCLRVAEGGGCGPKGREGEGLPRRPGAGGAAPGPARPSPVRSRRPKRSGPSPREGGAGCGVPRGPASSGMGGRRADRGTRRGAGGCAPCSLRRRPAPSPRSRGGAECGASEGGRPGRADSSVRRAGANNRCQQKINRRPVSYSIWKLDYEPPASRWRSPPVWKVTIHAGAALPRPQVQIPRRGPPPRPNPPRLSRLREFCVRKGQWMREKYHPWQTQVLIRYKLFPGPTPPARRKTRPLGS